MSLLNPLFNPSASTRNNIQIGAVGLVIELEVKEGYCPLDISDATIKNIIIKKPDNTVVTKPAAFESSGTNGLIYYKTVIGDLDQAGEYSVQAYLETPAFVGYSTITSFMVYANL